MLKIMAHENLDEWGHDASIERETIRAVVNAFAADRIDLTKPGSTVSKNKLRFAPSFCFGVGEGRQDRPYTADTINGFLSGTMSSRTIQYTLQALCLMEQGHLSEDDLGGLSSSECRIAVEETGRAIKQAAIIEKEAKRKAQTARTQIQRDKLEREGEEKAKRVIKDTAGSVTKVLQGDGGQQQARQAGTQARVKVTGKGELPEINTAAVSLSRTIKNMLDMDGANGQKLDQLIKHADHMGSESIHTLILALDELIEWAEGYKRRLESAQK